MEHKTRDRMKIKIPITETKGSQMHTQDKRFHRASGEYQFSCQKKIILGVLNVLTKLSQDSVCSIGGKFKFKFRLSFN